MRYPHHRAAAASPRLSGRAGAFTLIEVLVAMTVLLILVVLVTQMTDRTVATVAQSRRYIDADSQAREVFSRMAGDFANLLQRSDVDFSTFKHPSNQPAASPSPAPVPYPSLTNNLETVAAESATSGNGNDFFAFYTQSPGYYVNNSMQFTGNARAPVSLVAYNVKADQYRSNVPNLQRLSKALGWDADTVNSPPAWRSVAFLPITLTSSTGWPYLFTNDPGTGLPDADYTTVGDQVFRMEYTYLLKASQVSGTPARLSVTPWDTTTGSTHNSFNAFSDVAAIVVAIAVCDPNNRLLVNSNSLPSMTLALPDAVDGTDIKTSWNTLINDPTATGFAAKAGVPQTTAAGVRVYQRFFYLDGH